MSTFSASRHFKLGTLNFEPGTSRPSLRRVRYHLSGFLNSQLLHPRTQRTGVQTQNDSCSLRSFESTLRPIRDGSPPLSRGNSIHDRLAASTRPSRSIVTTCAESESEIAARTRLSSQTSAFVSDLSVTAHRTTFSNKLLRSVAHANSRAGDSFPERKE